MPSVKLLYYVVVGNGSKKKKESEAKIWNWVYKNREQLVTAADGKLKGKNARGILNMTKIIPTPKTALISEMWIFRKQPLNKNADQCSNDRKREVIILFVIIYKDGRQAHTYNEHDLFALDWDDVLIVINMGNVDT